MLLAKLDTTCKHKQQIISVNTLCFPLRVSLQVGSPQLLVIKDAQYRTVAHLSCDDELISSITSTKGRATYLLRDNHKNPFLETHCFDAFNNRIGLINHGSMHENSDDLRVHVFKNGLLKYVICNDHVSLKYGRLAWANSGAANDEKTLLRVGKQPNAVMVDYKRMPIFTIESLHTRAASPKLLIHKTGIVAQADAGVVFCALIESAFSQLII